MPGSKRRRKSLRKKANHSKRQTSIDKTEKTMGSEYETMANVELTKEKVQKSSEGKLVKGLNAFFKKLKAKKESKKTEKKASSKRISRFGEAGPTDRTRSTEHSVSKSHTGSAERSGSKELSAERSGSKKYSKESVVKKRAKKKILYEGTTQESIDSKESIRKDRKNSTKNRPKKTVDGMVTEGANESCKKKKSTEEEEVPEVKQEQELPVSSSYYFALSKAKHNIRSPKHIKRLRRPYFYDPSRDAIPNSLKELKELAPNNKRIPRPYFYDEVADAIPWSLREQPVSVVKKRTLRPFYRDLYDDSVPISLKSKREKAASKRKRTPRPYYSSAEDREIPKSLRERPFCYDERLDGVAESLLSLSETESSEISTLTARDILEKTPSALTPPPTKEVEIVTDKTDSSSESEYEIKKTVKGKEPQEKLRQENDEISSDSSITSSVNNATLSAQKLVKGKKILDFARDYVDPKKSVISFLKLQHQLLLKQERHISDFCRSEASEKGKNRSPSIVIYNEGAVHLLPTRVTDSRYIHASQINLACGNYIIAQGPTEHSLIDFYRMIWQYQVPLVICLEPLTDPRTCFPYFGFKQQEVIKAEDRISFETNAIMETTISNLFVYEVTVTNFEIKNRANNRRIQIMHYNKWTRDEPVPAATLIKMIGVMNTLINASESMKPIVVQGCHGTRRTAIFLITILLTKQALGPKVRAI